MFANMKLATKIGIGFGLVIVIAMILGGVSLVTMDELESHQITLADEYVPEVRISNDIERNLLTTMMWMMGYGLSEETNLYERGKKTLQETADGLAQADELADRSQSLVKLKPAVEKIRMQLNAYRDQIEQTVALNKKLDECRTQLDAAAASYMKNCNDFSVSQHQAMIKELDDEATSHDQFRERRQKIELIGDIINLGQETRVACFKGQALREPKLIEQANTNFEQMQEKFAAIRKLTRLEFNIRQLDQTEKAARQYQQAMNELKDNWVKLQQLGQQRYETSSEALNSTRVTASAGMDHAQALASDGVEQLSMAQVTMIVGLSVALVVSFVVAWVLSRSVTRPLQNIFRGLKRFSTIELRETGQTFRSILQGLQTSSQHTTGSAMQISATSQQMAEGSSEQAASIEETSASMEEIASVVKNNAGHTKRASEMARHNTSSTREAKTLTDEALSFAQDGNKSVNHMSDAISSIKNSAEETAKIIKTIDEIAFQTNLLALNAAVEAARAGDAGKGFAVVAEEVRNLAQRSATAAKNTAELINESARNSESGVTVVEEVRTMFNKIVDIIEKVATNVSEITASSEEQNQLITDVSSASEEQARGIEQVNVGVSQIDQVTQKNAANAEELAAAAEELNSQAVELNGMVQQLRSLVDAVNTRADANGPSGETGYQSSKPASTRPTRQRQWSTPNSSSAERQERSDSSDGIPSKMASDKNKEDDASSSDPETVIPFEEEEGKKTLSQF